MKPDTSTLALTQCSGSCPRSFSSVLGAKSACHVDASGASGRTKNDRGHPPHTSTTPRDRYVAPTV